MKALDKVFDTSTAALLVINFISLKQKRISMKKKETDKKDGIVTTLQKKPNRIIKSK